MDLSEYRNSLSEQARTSDLLRLIPEQGRHALDVGARDGHFSVLMADRFERVTALDLSEPDIADSRIRCVRGNATDLQFCDSSFDFVFCAEVLEHIPQELLGRACREMERVASGHILIGVPYRQDIRVGRTTCYSCMERNPPWGHVNTFDEARLASLFAQCDVEVVSFVGRSNEQTNALSTALMDFAGNPYGTYDQDEPCVHCGRPLLRPPERSAAQKIATRLAFWARHATEVFAGERGNWIHMRLRKRSNA